MRSATPKQAVDAPLRTPDGRYLVVRGRLWRATNPDLPAEARDALVHALMDARRAVKAALRTRDAMQLKAARGEVDAAKTGLGERGAVWWNDGAPDFNRHLIKNTPLTPIGSPGREQVRKRIKPASDRGTQAHFPPSRRERELMIA